MAWGTFTLGAAWLITALGDPEALASDAACGLQPPEMLQGLPPVPNKSNQRFDPGAPFLRREGDASAGPVQGILSGKTVYLSAGHGLTWTASGWRTQRGNTNAIVEDLVSIEAVDQFLIPYLHAMGAYVVTVREPDLRGDAVIVDDGAAMLEGAPQEGPGATGWGEVGTITADSTNPFASGSARSLVASANETGGLQYAPQLPSSGYYNVYVSFVQGDDRVSDAHWMVRHAGGETHYRIDQRRHGSTWVLLGEFYFEAGAPAESASVLVLDDSADVGAIVSADAVRFGGGPAVNDRGGGVNERPLAEQCARYYTQYNGAPPSVFAAFTDDGTSDVGARSRFSAWEHEDGEDAVYVAWHSNAPSPRRGTSSYTYGPGAPPQPLSNFTGVAGSRELQDAIHEEIIGDLRAAWDPEWVDEGRYTAYFGEVNPSHNPEMPAVLVEVAYHDTAEDADALRDPSWRRLTSRAIAQGIARYFAEQDGVPVVLPPEPPSAIVVGNDDAGGLTVRWRAPEASPGAGDPPTGYFVQRSTNGLGFDDGEYVTDTSFALTDLSPGDVRYVRIVSANDGGRSLPSHVVGARVAESGQASVLVVGGFDRLDAGLLLDLDMSAFALGTVQRMFLHRMNDFTYAARHGDAIAEAGFSFDGATDDAIELAEVSLGGYQAVDWFTGEDSIGDDPLSALARDAITDYLDGGGRLLVSGSELAWALDEYGMGDEPAFFNERLHAAYVADDAETYDVDAGLGPLADVPAFSFADPTAYDPRYPDVLQAESGGGVVLEYAGGVGAGVAWGEGSPDERGVVLGFPFETVADAEQRAALMAAVLAFFEVEEADGDDTGGTGGSEGGETEGTDGTASAGTSGGDTTSADAGDSGDTEPGADAGGDGCGCVSGSDSTSTALGLLVVLLGLRRRRRYAHAPST